MSVPATATPAASAASRFIRLIRAKTDGAPAVVLICTQTKRATYFVEPCENDISDGRAFLIREQEDPDAEIYAVVANGSAPSCECLGWLRHGTCKHVHALAALVAAKKI